MDMSGCIRIGTSMNVLRQFDLKRRADALFCWLPRRRFECGVCSYGNAGSSVTGCDGGLCVVMVMKEGRKDRARSVVTSNLYIFSADPSGGPRHT